MHATEQALLELGSATLGESGGRPMRARVRPAWLGATIASPAFPVQCTPGDNLAIHVAAARAPEGHALVVDVGSERELGYWGEVLTTAAQARGLSGLVIDGCVRDVAALAAHGFPVFSAGIALPGATKDRPGQIGSPAAVGGVEVALGDWIVGDVDGVTVIPGDSIDAVLDAGRAREAKERGFFEQLEAGATTIDLLALDASRIEDGSAPA
ncbi:MAG TPA: dimethylmenaquinone methyltransferase [Acidimicrobiia bacterium]|nr:dimethylmenaquinone methyltransferase [Acidimicrobiia bacterium]